MSALVLMRPEFPGLTISYKLWRFLYWQKDGSLSYDQIDEQVRDGKIVPNDSQVDTGDEE